MVSLAGAAIFKKVTKIYKSKFKLDRNKLLSIMAYTCLTVRHTGRAETKVGHNDPIILHGKVIA